ncbi:branched-chain amino acid transporter II carrier protein [Bhargavaea cecembensis]|uniref:Branched-chain amino acid transport system carrier protein n=1 Tax=Bhargavaea cecembensis TaxID=394098 RepID=A0A165GLB3_9BACL|nr:branched-chain amino acid transport system II carrier protein [Bhargavaea cecembensis]KZE36839.1 branched-chain amino acid transporter II carrier protein [Bhargavaea cecembensis]
MKENLSFSKFIAVGVMLFALFFGAGNLIFPAQLGQLAGDNFWPAIIGFLITGVGLPFLGVIAIGYSGSSHLQDLASRVHPVYAVIFTSVLYLTIGPFFAAPRTGTVAFEVGITPYANGPLALLLFTAVFFGITLWLSLNPAKIVDRVGKILAPGIVILLLVLIAAALFNPMGAIQPATEGYLGNAFAKGFTEGYNTMDALAALVFAIIVINAVKAMGLKTKEGIMNATFKAGVVAASLLGILYVGIAYIGATSVEQYGLFDTGGPVLSTSAEHFFGAFGTALLAIIITLACLTTAIGLMIANAEYFHSLFPKISYKVFVTIFTTFTFVVSNFGLANIITYSVPVLMLLYPLAISLILMAFTSKLFNHSRLVYVSATVVALAIGIVDGLKTLAGTLDTEFAWLQPIVDFYTAYLPFYADGLGWLIPVVAVMILTGIIARVTGPATNTAEA